MTGSHDYTVRVWGTADGAAISVLKGHTQFVRQVAIDPTGRWVATGGNDHFISLWEIESGQAYQVLADQAARAELITFSPDGQTVAAFDTNETINVWAVAGGYRLQRYQLHFAAITAVAFSPDGRWLVVGSTDCALYLWDVRQPTHPQLVVRLTGHRNRLSTLAFSPDGSTIAIGDYQGDIRLWSSHHWESCVLPGSAGDGNVAFSPTGQLLASADDEGLRLWSVADGGQIELLLGAATGTHICAFSPDGRRIASSHRDHTLCLWEIDPFAGSVLQQTLHHHTNIVTKLLFSPDGRYLFSTLLMAPSAVGTRIPASSKRVGRRIDVQKNFVPHPPVRGPVGSPDKTFLDIYMGTTTRWRFTLTVSTWPRAAPIRSSVLSMSKVVASPANCMVIHARLNRVAFRQMGRC